MNRKQIAAGHRAAAGALDTLIREELLRLSVTAANGEFEDLVDHESIEQAIRLGREFINALEKSIVQPR